MHTATHVHLYTHGVVKKQKESNMVNEMNASSERTYIQPNHCKWLKNSLQDVNMNHFLFLDLFVLQKWGPWEFHTQDIQVSFPETVRWNSPNLESE